MAEFFPRVPDEIWQEGDTRPSNEPELVFRRQLEAALADKSWMVIQNLVVQSDDRVGSREIDFLVIDPERGFVVIEVKGGDYRYEPEIGWFRKVGDDKRLDDRGAPKQATGAMYHLVNYLASRLLHPRSRPPYLHGWLVALPETEIKQSTLPTEAQGHVLDSKTCCDAAKLCANIDDLLDALAREFEHVPIGEQSNMPEIARQYILPTMHARFAIRDQITNARVIENDLLRPVRLIMDAAHEIDRLQVRGYPGTGKTFAALHRARRDLDAEKRVLVLCYNIPLAASLTARLGAKPVRPSTPPEEIRERSCVVGRLFALAESLASHANPPLALPSPDAGKEYFDALLAALERAAKDGLFGRFDSIVIDEGQDFSPAMLRALDALAIDCPRIAFFHDPNQRLYDGATPDELRARFGGPMVLRENLRNSAAITDFLRTLDPARLSGLVTPPSVRSGLPVVVWEYKSGDTKSQVAAIERIVKHLVYGEDVRHKDIAIISPFRFDRGSLAGMTTLADFPLMSLEDAVRQEAGACLRRETLHRFKGLEAPAVILHDVAGAGMNVTFEAILTGCSRAQHALYVLRSDDYAGPAPLPVQGTLP